MKKIFAAVLCLAFIELTAQINTTISSGDWSDSQIWSKGSVPVSTDSIIIDAYVKLDTGIVVDASGLLFIDGCGVLCGDYNLVGAFTNYGELRIKTGEIYRPSFNYGVYTCSAFNIIYTAQGGSLDNCCGGSVQVGFPVDCSAFPRSCANVLSIEEKVSARSYFQISTTPSGKWLVEFTGKTRSLSLMVFDITGRLIYQQTVDANSIELPASDWETGVYIIHADNSARKMIRH